MKEVADTLPLRASGCTGGTHRSEQPQPGREKQG